MDNALLFQHELSTAPGPHIPVVVLTDSLRFLHVLIRTSNVTIQKRFMIFISSICEVAGRDNISEMGWKLSSISFADALTELKLRPSLNAFVHLGHLELDLIQ